MAFKGHVRPSHAENDGKIFSWDTPPATGHPGEDHNCRCTAVPLPDDDPRLNVPDSRAARFCSDLLKDIERTKDGLADALDAIKDFSIEERRRLEQLPGAAIAYGDLIFELANLAGSLTGPGAILRSISIGRRVSRFDVLTEQVGLVGLLSDAETLISKFSTARAVWNLSELRRLTNTSKSLWRRLEILMENWENAACSIHIDD